MRNSSNIFEGLGDIDILLDSFPHNGGTMLFDALWMGVPALTLASRPPVGRIGASVMTNIGLADWVAKDEYEYVDKAESFAKNIEELARLRTSMRERMKASPLMDEAGFARDVENAFQNMWHRWCSEAKLSPKLSDIDEIKITKSKLSSEQDE
jgi:predicted O-linked N-acetylglucosamine transferase (SPINDLY family)